MFEFLFASSLLLQLAPASIAWEVRAERGSTPIESSRPFEAVALSWSSPIDVSVHVRTSMDGILWSNWVVAPIDQDLTDHAAGRYFTSIVHSAAASRYLEYSFTTANDLREIVITFFAPPATGPQLEPFASEELTLGPLPIRSRTDWGCPDGEGSRWAPGYTNVTHAVVHHTAGANSVADWDAEVRNIWYFHTVTRGWGDIGYNYLIDPNGVIYEGRAGGPGAIGAHFSCRNTNTVGVSLLGTFTGVLPTTEAINALTRLLVELSRRHLIKPDSFVYHTPTALNLPAIPGHRDANPSPQACSRTECPGDAMYAHLPAVRTDVATCPPVIIAQPLSTVTPVGGSATLSVTVTGSEPMTFQWYSGDSGNTETPLQGSSGASLTVSPATRTSYWVRITNRCGITDSQTAVVRIGLSGRPRGVRRGQ